MNAQQVLETQAWRDDLARLSELMHKIGPTMHSATVETPEKNAEAEQLVVEITKTVKAAHEGGPARLYFESMCLLTVSTVLVDKMLAGVDELLATPIEGGAS